MVNANSPAAQKTPNAAAMATARAVCAKAKEVSILHNGYAALKHSTLENAAADVADSDAVLRRLECEFSHYCPPCR